MLVSISKIFRISGLRIGFLVGPPAVVAQAARYLWPWSVNSLGQAAVRWLAESRPVLEGFVAETRNYLESERQAFEERLRHVSGLKIYPGAASFLLIRLPPGSSAGEACLRFSEERILIRDCSNFVGLSESFIRISPKGPEVNRRAAHVLAALSAKPMDLEAHG